MKLLFRFTATLTTWLSTSLGVLALPIDEVVRILQGVPVFTIVDPEGGPLVALDNNNEKVTGVFISQQQANDFLQELKKQKPDVGSKVTVQPVALGEVVKIAKTEANQPEPLGFAYVPIPSEVQAAKKIPNSEYKGGVPLFVARRGKDQDYLTIQQDDQQIIPFFLEASQINEMVERLKQEQPSIAETIVIDVIAMENIISTLQKKDDTMLKQIRIVPTQEAIQFISSISADSGLTEASTNQTSQVYAQASCQATVDAVAKEMRKKGTKVDMTVNPTRDDSGYFSYMENTTRLGIITFSLGGVLDSNRGHNIANNILSSRVLMKNYASRILNNCRGTGYVEFTLQGSDFTENFGMADNGKLGVEKCSDYQEELTNLISDVKYHEYSMAGSAYCAYVIPNF